MSRLPALSVLTGGAALGIGVLVAGTASTASAAPTAASVAAQAVVRSVPLNGANEICHPLTQKCGDPDGHGSAKITVYPNAGRVCFDIRTRGIGRTLAAGHIHFGSPQTAGPVVVPLFMNVHGRSVHGCVDAPGAADIAHHPGAYYVNVHTPAYPDGAIRGQLNEN